MTNMDAIWEAERESYRLQFVDEILPLIKELFDSSFIIGTISETTKVKTMTDNRLYEEIEQIIRNGK